MLDKERPEAWEPRQEKASRRNKWPSQLRTENMPKEVAVTSLETPREGRGRGQAAYMFGNKG